MTVANELTPNGTNAPKRKPGRPRTTPDLNALLEQIEQLKETIREERAQVRERQVTLDVIPTASEGLHPGTYIQVGVDATNSPIMGKVRWTRDWIAKTYPSVTFTPARSMRVAPHGVSYDLGADHEVTVPQIVKDIYDDVRKQEVDHNIRYRSLSAGEDADLAVKASEQPGTKQWSRLYKAGYGLQVAPPEAAAVETPAT